MLGDIILFTFLLIATIGCTVYCYKKAKGYEKCNEIQTAKLLYTFGTIAAYLAIVSLVVTVIVILKYTVI